MNRIETRIPCGNWARQVTDVSERAKTGHDWSGGFLDTEKLVDLETGDLVVVCSNDGSRRHPIKHARLYVLRQSGEWSKIAEIKSNEWAYDLRGQARDWLAKSPEQRNLDAYRLTRAKVADEVASWEKIDSDYARSELDKSRKILADIENKLAKLEVPQPEQPDYCPSPDLSRASTDTLLCELAKRGVSVTVMGPPRTEAA